MVISWANCIFKKSGVSVAGFKFVRPIGMRDWAVCRGARINASGWVIHCDRTCNGFDCWQLKKFWCPVFGKFVMLTWWSRQKKFVIRDAAKSRIWVRKITNSSRNSRHFVTNSSRTSRNSSRILHDFGYLVGRVLRPWNFKNNFFTLFRVFSLNRSQN